MIALSDGSELVARVAHVSLVVRADSLAAGMSDYLIKQIETTPNVEVRLRTRVIDGRGEVHLEGLTLEDAGTGRREDVAAAAVFVLIGAEPHTEWLRDAMARDERGYVLTDRDVAREGWPLKRAPLPFETSMPGVFAVGDVRHGSVKLGRGGRGGLGGDWLRSSVPISAGRRDLSVAPAATRAGASPARRRTRA